jgi:hypothetical protein
VWTGGGDVELDQSTSLVSRALSQSLFSPLCSSRRHLPPDMAHAREHLPSPLTRSAAIHPTTTTLSPSICLSLSHTTVDLQDDEEKGETIGEEKSQTG